MFDLGGTYIRSAVAAADGTLRAVERRPIPNVFSGDQPSRVWDRIVELVCEHCERSADLEPDGVVISFPGPVRDRRIPLAAPTICGSAAPDDIAASIAARTRLPVHLLNDVSAAAWYIGEHIDVDRFLVVTISSGIGSKIYDRGTAARVIDDAPFAGEIGHVAVDASRDAPRCDCGERGHLGAIASGRGTERLARARAASDMRAFLHSACAVRYGATPRTLRNEEHLVPAALAGDRWARAVIAEAMRPLALALITVVHACALERLVVIGGFAGALGDWYIKELESLMLAASGRTFNVPRNLVQRLDVEDDVCLRGAASFARTLPTLVR